MRDKYIEEEFQRYFIECKRFDGRVVLSSDDGEIAIVSEYDAERLIKQRDEVVNKLCAMAQAFNDANPHEFFNFWYGGKNGNSKQQD